MERTSLREIHWPELLLAGFMALFLLFVMVRSSTTSCHHWKQRITEVGGAFLAAAGEEEYPQPETGVPEERTALRNAARNILDARPTGCL
ncbi:MAG: hypothetical protein ACRDZ3_21675 [Acidimicrobiia bacterium]